MHVRCGMPQNMSSRSLAWRRQWGDVSGKFNDFITTIEHLGIILQLIVCITTCIANGTTTRIWHVVVRSSPPPLPFSSPPGAQVYIMSVLIFFSLVYHSFFVNNTFYVIQFFHSPASHNGGSSSHRNELTPRDSSSHSNQPSDNLCELSVMWCDDLWCCLVWSLVSVRNCVNISVISVVSVISVWIVWAICFLDEKGFSCSVV
jgi:hypothetical protein